MYSRLPQRVVSVPRQVWEAEGGEASVFGFRVQTREALRFLRAGGGKETLEVLTAPEPRVRPQTEPLASWKLRGGEDPVQVTLHRAGRGFEYWVADVGGFYVDPEGARVEMPDSTDEILREQRLWGVPTTLCYMARGDFSLHAAAVEVDGGAIVLAAPGRHGKTTLAMGFHESGYRVLSEDLSCCRADPEPILFPGPAILRVRPDVYDGEPPIGTHVVVRQRDRVYLGIDRDRRGSGAPVPLRAAVFLRESAGEVRIERAPPPVALADLWHLNFRLPESEGRATSFRQLSRLASGLDTWNLYRPLTRECLEEAVGLIVRHLKLRG